MRKTTVRGHLPASLLIGGLFLIIGETAVGAVISGQIKVDAGPQDRRDVPVQAAILVPSTLTAKAQVVLTSTDGKKLSAQLISPALLDSVEPAPEGKSWQVLWWILPHLPANQSTVFNMTITDGTPAAESFVWSDTAGKHLDLLLSRRPVLRYMWRIRNTSSGPVLRLHQLYL
jgi:hypothetical protein